MKKIIWDFTQGLVKDTESSLDFALEGKGDFYGPKNWC